MQEYQQQVDELEEDYQSHQRTERPTSSLALARKRLQAVVKRAASRTSVCKQTQCRLDKTTAQHSHQQAELAALHQCLLRFEQVDNTIAWTRVGANAELVAWPRLQLKHCPYALDVALERFYTGNTLKHSALFHFGSQPVTEQLPGWFEQYNGKQTIEAGIKESKQVFSLHHLKVRSEPAPSIFKRPSSCSRRISFDGLLAGWKARSTRSKTL